MITNNRVNSAPAGQFKDPINGRFYPFERAELDHYNPTVVSHWNNIGHNSPQSVRESFYNDPNALRILSDDENRRLGREEVARYTRTVGENFRGPED